MSKFSQGNTKASKLTAEMVLDMREKYASGKYTQGRLSREFQVSISTVRNIVNGLTWQGVDAVKPAHQERFEQSQSIRRLSRLMEAQGMPVREEDSVKVAAPDVGLDAETIERLNRELLDIPATPSGEEVSIEEILNRRAQRAQEDSSGRSDSLLEAASEGDSLSKVHAAVPKSVEGAAPEAPPTDQPASSRRGSGDDGEALEY